MIEDMKRILFVCGTLDPGKDGVGDYTRKLVDSLNKLGCQCGILALNDRFVKDSFEEKNTADCYTLRCSNKLSWKERIEFCQIWIARYNPTQLFLQYVPFSFQSKGLHYGLESYLMKIGKNMKWNIMFHELSVGLDKEAPLKIKLWGIVQRVLITRLVSKLNPENVYTQSSLYKNILESKGIKAKLMPLFSNIPQLSVRKEQVTDNIIFVLFGSIHPGAPVGGFLKELKSVCDELNKKPEFIFIGRNGAELKTWTNYLDNFGIDYEILGDQSEEEVSWILNKASYGISTTPYFQSEKSGVVAAMKEHGLSIICVARSWTPAAKYLPALISNSIRLYKMGVLKDNLCPADTEVCSADTIALQLLSDLGLSMSNKHLR